jgi:hypothetical protein
LVNEVTKSDPWKAYFIRLVHMSDHAEFLRYTWEDGSADDDSPLYEGKLFNIYDHRFATFGGTEKRDQIAGQPRQVTGVEKADGHFAVVPRYMVKAPLVNQLFDNYRDYLPNWFLMYRKVVRATDERTCIASAVPKLPGSDKCPGLGFSGNGALLLANINSMVLDFVARQKIAGISLSWFIFKQLPVLPPSAYCERDEDFITSRVVKLVYTAKDLKAFADDVGYVGQPYQWNMTVRERLRAELDAYYAHLYALTRDELRYILDPKDVFGEDFPSETFRVLKEREIKEYGEYRTQRLVLADYDELAKSDRFRDEVPKRVSSIHVPAKAAKSSGS